MLNEWKETKTRFGRFVGNQEIVMARARYQGKNPTVRVSIGLLICNILDIKEADRIKLFVSTKDPHLIKVKKTLSNENSYKLTYAKSANFLSFETRWRFFPDIRMYQTIPLDYEMTEDKSLIIHIDKLRNQ